MQEESQKEQSLGAQALQLLRTAIVKGELLPGARLRLDALQRQHGLSSSPLREALNRLVAERLVQADEGRGFWVAPVNVQELRDLTRLRVLLDSEALRDSIQYGDDTWEAGIVAGFHRLSKVEARLGDALLTLDDDWSERHREFHMALLSGCRTPRMLELCKALFDESERYRRLSAQMRQRPRKKNREHQALMDAALTRDFDRASELLRAHIEHTADSVAEILGAPAAPVAKPTKTPAPTTPAQTPKPVSAQKMKSSAAAVGAKARAKAR